MTIYAIVNTLVTASEESPRGDSSWTVVSPSAILQGGNPYFVPDFADKFEARPALALRIGKLGKSIAKRFAYRYVDAVAPACVMLASDLLDSLRMSGLPWSKAISYDRSIAVGPFVKIPFERTGQIESELCITDTCGEYKAVTSAALHHLSVEDIIYDISRDNALKTGDLILIGINNSGPTLAPGQRLILSLDGTESLKFNIR